MSDQIELYIEEIPLPAGEPVPWCVGDIFHITVKGTERTMIDAPAEVASVRAEAAAPPNQLVRLYLKVLPT